MHKIQCLRVEDKVYYAFMVMAHNYRSHEIVRKYFDRFIIMRGRRGGPRFEDVRFIIGHRTKLYIHLSI